MLFIDHKFDKCIENLAFDEVLLLNAEQGSLGESIRLWQADDYAVVLGRASKVQEDVDIEMCKQDDIPVLRRISGGGTVLQGPGCINYSIISSYKKGPGYCNVISSYKIISHKIIDILALSGINAEYHPISDIAVDSKRSQVTRRPGRNNIFYITVHYY